MNLLFNFYILHSITPVVLTGVTPVKPWLPYTLLAADFEKTSWIWQLSVFQQQVEEWLELQFSQSQLSLPNWFLPQWLINIIKGLAWLLLGLFVVWLGWRLWQILEPYLYSFVAQTGASNLVKKQALSVDRWLERSQAYFSKGNYREACRCLYLAMLQHLHDTGIAPDQSSRTDGEYLQLVQQLPQSQSYQTLITTHEQLCFGNAEIVPETFERCRQAYREIAEE